MTLCTYHLAHGIDKPGTHFVGGEPEIECMCEDCFAGKPITPQQERAERQSRNTAEWLRGAESDRKYRERNRIRQREKALEYYHKRKSA